MKVLKTICTLIISIIIDICVTGIMLWLTCLWLHIILTNFQFVILTIIVTLWNIKIDIKILKNVDN